MDNFEINLEKLQLYINKQNKEFDLLTRVYDKMTNFINNTEIRVKQYYKNIVIYLVELECFILLHIITNEVDNITYIKCEICLDQLDILKYIEGCRIGISYNTYISEKMPYLEIPNIIPEIIRNISIDDYKKLLEIISERILYANIPPSEIIGNLVLKIILNYIN